MKRGREDLPQGQASTARSSPADQKRLRFDENSRANRPPESTPSGASAVERRPTVDKVVGWGSWDEWRQVRAWLSSPSLEERQRGLRRVRAWRARVPVPLAIETTASLLETHAMDTFPPTHPAYELRMAYSMAIVRMVNGLVEPEQKGAYARSVWSISKQLGIPRVLVDLRHSATHNVLPSLDTLRGAAAEALRWLDANYWQQQENALNDITHRTKALLQRYIQLMHRSYGKSADIPTNPVQRRAMGLECMTTLVQSMNRSTAREILVPMLVKKNYLVPKVKMNPKEFNRYQEAWAPLLETCIGRWGTFFGMLLARIVDTIVELTRDPAQKDKVQALMNWLSHLLYASGYQKKVNDKAITIPVDALIISAARCASPWNSTLSKLFLPWLPSADKQDKLRRMLADTRARKIKSRSEGLGVEVFEELLRLLKNGGLTRPIQPSNGGEAGPWTKCDRWTPCSVGLTVNNELPDLTLPLEFDYNGAISLVPVEPPADPIASVLPFMFAAQPQQQDDDAGYVRPAPSHGNKPSDSAKRRVKSRRERTPGGATTSASSTSSSAATTTSSTSSAEEELNDAETESPTEQREQQAQPLSAALLFSPAELVRL